MGFGKEPRKRRDKEVLERCRLSAKRMIRIGGIINVNIEGGGADAGRVRRDDIHLLRPSTR